MKETSVEATVIQLLRLRGFKVHKTSRVRRKCPKCGHVDTRPEAGITAGIADLLVRRNSWALYVWVPLEVKGPTTPVSAEQKAQYEAGELVIVRGDKKGQVAITARYTTSHVQEIADALKEITKGGDSK